MNESMAERLKNLRKQQHLSQSAVARQLHVTPALISAYEKQERHPSLDNLIRLADIYHTTTDYILGRTQALETEAPYINVAGLSSTQISLLRQLIETMQNN